MTLKIALVGVGVIARTQHIPALAQSPDWELAATVSQSTKLDGIDNFSSVEALLSARPDIAVVSLCVPPAPRFAMAKAALDNGRHVMLEKPPGATVRECQLLHAMAQAAGLSLYATWHSREADVLDYCQQWLADKTISAFEINWKEDVRRWHPGQEWIWQPGGLGVFDPGINALSILTKILPEAVYVTGAELLTPSNKQTPIAAQLDMVSTGGAIGRADFDFRQQGEQIWEIKITTESGVLHLTEGGAKVNINGEARANSSDNFSLSAEYPRLYQRMAELVHSKQSECDLTPLELVADAFMLGRRELTEPFEF